MKRKKQFSLFTVLIVLFMLLFSASPVNAAATCSSEETAAQIVREAMVNREDELVIVYPIERAHLNEDDILAVARRIYDKAIEHTGVGREGDYLYFHENQFQYGFSYTDWGDSTVEVNLTFKFDFYTDAAQEAELTTKINEVLANLNLEGKSDYEKVKAIYDYICENVEYDHDNLNNEAYQLKYSAYAAMKKGSNGKGKAVCQGYANLFYRMANSAGLDARIVSGTSRGQGHAWNIVKVDGKYYNIDSTWDAGSQTYSYFLKGSGNFDEHTPDGDHPANYSSYNISAVDYVIPEQENPTETSTEALTEAPTQAPTEAPTQTPTEASTEAPTKAPAEPSTETPTEAPTQVPTEATTEAVRPTQSTGEEATEASTKAPTPSSTEAVRPTETPDRPSAEADNSTQFTTEEEEPTESMTEAEKTTETATERESEGTDSTEEQGKNEETPGGCGMPDGPIPTESGTTDDPKEKSKGGVLYIIIGAVGVAVVGTGVVVGRVIAKKRKRY